MSTVDTGARLDTATACSLPSLGEHIALWLEGHVPSQPGYEPMCGPDPETLPLVPVLARANRAGFVTAESQPGTPPETGFDGAVWSQRAAVEGWIEPHRLDRLVEAARRADLHVLTHPVLQRRFARREPRWVEVTRRNGRIVTGFGGQLRRSDVKFTYGECGPELVSALCASVQVTIAACDYGVDDRLWHVLDEWATRHTDPGSSAGNVPSASLPATKAGTATHQERSDMSSVDEIRNALALANEKANQVHGAVRQAALDVQEIQQTLTQAVGSSGHASAQQAVGSFAQAHDALENLHGVVSAGTTAVDEYAAAL